MKLEPKEVAGGGNFIGQEVYVCDFRWDDFDKRPARNIRPTKVLIRDISETTKRIYYSNVFLSEIKKENLLKSSMIKIYDNTGYRSFPGVPLNIFTTENEAIKYYIKMKDAVVGKFKEYRDMKLSHINLIEEELKNII
jgi:hypothetical protein